MTTSIAGKQFELADYARTLREPTRASFAHFALNVGRSTPETLRLFKSKITRGRL